MCNLVEDKLHLPRDTHLIVFCLRLEMGERARMLDFSVRDCTSEFKDHRYPIVLTRFL